MPNSTIIEITCPRCGHKWSVDVTALEKEQGVLKAFTFRSASPPNVTQYRVQCPKDYTWVVVDVREVKDE